MTLLREKYDPDKADRRAVKLQHKAHVHYKYGEDIWSEVEGAVMEDWSPDEIVGRRKNEGRETPSVPTIYRWLKDMPELELHLRHLGKSYRKRGQAKDARGSIKDQQWIDDRPAVVDEKMNIPVRRSRQSGKMGATIPDLWSHLFIAHLFGQIQRVVIARDFISLFARAARLQSV